MAKQQNPYPVIDVFAGPGGLGEGFASARHESGQPRFECALSIENEEHAYQTLKLRHFLRHFKGNKHPSLYHRYLEGEISRDELYSQLPREADLAEKSAVLMSLGSTPQEEVNSLIQKNLKGRASWALVGGPPCQAYSLVGRSRMMGDKDFEKDSRFFLYREYLQIIADLQPPVFVMENVKGLLSATVRDQPIITRIIKGLIQPPTTTKGEKGSAGYDLFSLTQDGVYKLEEDPKFFLIKAEHYGIPQARHRMFIVGIRNDLNIEPKQLQPHAPPTVKETIGNLPKIRSGLSRGHDSFDNWLHEISKVEDIDLISHLNGAPYTQKIKEGLDKLMVTNGQAKIRSSTKYPKSPNKNHETLEWMHDTSLTTLTGHESRSHMGSDLRRYLYAAVFADKAGVSPKLADFPPELLPNHHNVQNGYTNQMFPDRFRVQLQNNPATTITSHISKDGHYFIHYDPKQCRSLTVREAARLQTFPDNYKFEGPRTSQYQQIGNAVPPYLALQIADIIAEVLDSVKE